MLAQKLHTQALFRASSLVNTTEPLIPDMQANTHHLSTPNLPPQYCSVLSSPSFLSAIPFHHSPEFLFHFIMFTNNLKNIKNYIHFVKISTSTKGLTDSCPPLLISPEASIFNLNSFFSSYGGYFFITTVTEGDLGQHLLSHLPVQLNYCSLCLW